MDITERLGKAKSKLKTQTVWNDGYAYFCVRSFHPTTAGEGTDVRYLKCRDPICSATAKLVNERFTYTEDKHNHPRNELEAKMENFKQNLKLYVRESSVPLKVAYSTIAATDSIGALHCPMSSLHTSMQRWRREGFRDRVPKLESLGALGTNLQTGSWKNVANNFDGTFYSGHVEASDDLNALIFSNAKYISACFKDTPDLYIDSNCWLAPQNPFVHTVLTIFATTKKKYIFPIAYVLMQGDSQVLYEAVFNYFQDTLAPKITPKFIICAYEINLNAALRSVFADSNIHGSYYHYIKAIFTKAQALGITHQFINDGEALKVLKRYYVLPLLPYDQIQCALKDLEDVRKDLFCPLWDYVSVKWLKKIGPIHMSVYRQPHRTLQFWTSYNLKLNNSFQDTRADMLTLIEALKKTHNLTRLTNKKIADGKEVDPWTLEYRNDQQFHENLIEKWSDLSTKNVTVSDFINTACGFMEKEHALFGQFVVDRDVSSIDDLPFLRSSMFLHYTTRKNKK